MQHAAILFLKKLLLPKVAIELGNKSKNERQSEKKLNSNLLQLLT
jgi:hypothetical protein